MRVGCGVHTRQQGYPILFFNPSYHHVALSSLRPRPYILHCRPRHSRGTWTILAAFRITCGHPSSLPGMPHPVSPAGTVPEGRPEVWDKPNILNHPGCILAHFNRVRNNLDYALSLPTTRPALMWLSPHAEGTAEWPGYLLEPGASPGATTAGAS